MNSVGGPGCTKLEILLFILQRCPKATVLEAMKVGGFSDAEIYDRAKI